MYQNAGGNETIQVLCHMMMSTSSPALRRFFYDILVTPLLPIAARFESTRTNEEQPE